MNKCSICKQVKEPGEFYNSKTSKSGRSSVCKWCHTNYYMEILLETIYYLRRYR